MKTIKLIAEFGEIFDTDKGPRQLIHTTDGQELWTKDVREVAEGQPIFVKEFKAGDPLPWDETQSFDTDYKQVKIGASKMADRAKIEYRETIRAKLAQVELED